MKRATLGFLFLALILLELWFLEGFLPYGWSHPISELLNNILLTKPYPPHDMGLEIEMFLREHLLLRIGTYAATAALAIANGMLMSKVWKVLQKP